MGVKPGYKQTDVGVIPEEWEVFQLSDNFRIYAGGDVPRHSVSNFRSETHPYPVFANALQERGLYGFTGERRATANSLTITARGYLGHAEYRDEEFFPIVRLLVLEPSGALDAQFTTFAVNERVKFAFESTGVPQLTAPQVGMYSVAAPPLPEQRAIAQTLSDVDRLLGGLDRLIAKKRDLKQAAKQQLLTGQTRIPGFHGEWTVKGLSKICSMKSGAGITSANIDQFSKYPCYGGNGLRGYATRFTHDGGYALVGRQGALCGNVYGVEGQFFASEHAIVVTAFEDTDIRWLTAVLGRMNLNQYSESSAQPGLSVSKILKLEITVPPTKAEQTAIAEVLTDMDAELAALEQRREKTRALKLAMMQELLTGRTRLV